MERFVLILIVGAFVTGSLLFLNIGRGNAVADDAIHSTQYAELAREAALAGLRATERKLAKDSNASWTNPSLYEASTTSYKGGSYAVTTELVDPGGDVIDVYVTAEYGPASIQVDARYERSFDEEGVPPHFRSVILTDELLHIAGNIDIFTLDSSYNANIHTNGTLSTNGNAFKVYGYGSYSGTLNSDELDNFQPLNDYNGEELNAIKVPPIDIPDATLDISLASYVEPSGNIIHKVNGNNIIVIDVRDLAEQYCSTGAIPAAKCTMSDHDGDGTPEYDLGRSEAFIWYAPNIVDLKNVHIYGNTIIYGAGGITVNEVTRGDLVNNEVALLFRTTGNIDIKGNDVITAAFWANGEVTFHGTPTMTGGITSPETSFQANGNFKLTYAVPMSVITTPGYANVYPVGPVLIAYAEWPSNPTL